jgi:hypothetical protein
MSGTFLRRLGAIRPLHAAVGLLILAALAPAFWHALHTPFTLVDDHGDWCVLYWTQAPDCFKAWARTTFAGDPQRYRPFFEFYNWATWRLFLDQPALHHLARWVVMLGALALALRAFRPFAGERPAAACALAACLFLLYPNQPAARLAPQELNAALFAALECLAVSRLLRAPGASLAAAGNGTLVCLIVGFAGLSLTKETNVILMAWILVWVAAGHNRPFTRRTGAVLLTMLAVIVYTVWRVRAVSRGAGYGTAPLSLDLLHRNAVWLVDEAFQRSTSWVVTAGLAALLGLAAARLLRCLLTGIWFRQDRFLLFLFGSFGAAAAAALTSWIPVLRYWHPMVLPMALLAAAGWTLASRTRLGTYPRLAAAILAAWTLYFAGANYGNYLFQYVIRRHAGEVDQAMLDRVAARVREGTPTAIGYREGEPEIEMTLHARAYFTHFLPYFRRENLPPLRDFPPEPGQPQPLLASPRAAEAGMELVEVHAADDRYPLFRAACGVSAWLQGRAACHLAGDAGAKDLDYAWRLWRPRPTPPTPNAR